MTEQASESDREFEEMMKKAQKVPGIELQLELDVRFKEYLQRNKLVFGTSRDEKL